MFKKTLSLILTLAMLISAMLVPVSALEYGEEWEDYEKGSVTDYTDVDDDFWAYDSIMRVSQTNWFGGYPDGSFKPNKSINRAEAMKVFVSFLSYKLKEVTKTSYHDVSASEWYAPYVEAGKELFPAKAAVNGMIPFRPEMPITREDTIYAIVTALGYDCKVKFADQSVLSMFKDENSLSSNVKAYAAVALEYKLVSGYTDGTIRGQNPLTRAEFATLLARATHVGFCTECSKKVIESISIKPSIKKVIDIGESFEIAATANYTDGTSEDYAEEFGVYDDDESGFVKISGNNVTAVKEGVCTIKFKNEKMKDIVLTVVVNKPTAAPTIKFSYYEEETAEESSEISGKVTDETNTGISMTCDGKRVIVGSDGAFEYTANLAIGKNIFVFTAENEYGNKSEKTVTITREKPTAAPKISVSFDDETVKESIVIEGTVTDTTETEVTLKCNEKTVKLGTDGSFKYTATLAVGENTFTFAAENEYGNKKEKTVTITRIKPTAAPKISISSFDGETAQESIALKGTVTDTTETEVTLKCNGKSVKLDTDGSFKYTATLAVGENTFAFTAENEYGNKSEKTAEVVRTKQHEHIYGAVKYEEAHPHNGYQLCECGDKKMTGTTTKLADCTTCNPPHVHTYGRVLYEDSHPHYGYKLCSCGDKVMTGTTTKLTGCSICYPPSYTYYIECVSSNGTSLKRYSDTQEYNTSKTITPPSVTGYITPSSREVRWDTASKTITFTYQPKSVDASHVLVDNEFWWKYTATSGLIYSVEAETRNRTANSVDVKISWTLNAKGVFYGWNCYFNATVSGNSTGNVKIVGANYLGYSGNPRIKTATSSWITVPVSATQTTLNFTADWWDDSPSRGSVSSKSIDIAAY